MGALALNVQKCGSSRFKRSKRMGAFALKAQKYRSSHFERSKVIKDVGALALNAQTVWELSL